MKNKPRLRFSELKKYHLTDYITHPEWSEPSDDDLENNLSDKDLIKDPKHSSDSDTNNDDDIPGDIGLSASTRVLSTLTELDINAQSLALKSMLSEELQQEPVNKETGNAPQEDETMVNAGEYYGRKIRLLVE